MKPDLSPAFLDTAVAKSISAQAAKVFTPQTPISTRALFAGRWDEINQLVDIVAQVGLHAVLYGERGVGKTSLANVIPFLLDYFDKEQSPQLKNRISVRVNANTTDNFSTVWCKAFDEIHMVENVPKIGFEAIPGKRRIPLRTAFGLGNELTIDDVRRTVTQLPDSVFVIDEFDRLPAPFAAQFTDLIKALADGSVSSTIIIVGVAETVDQLVRDHASITRALVQIPLGRMKRDELLGIITNAEKELRILFDQPAAETIAMMSQGLPHYTHLIGLLSTRAALNRWSSNITPDDVHEGMCQAVKAADLTISKQYSIATRSAQAAALYQHVLLACAVTAKTDGDSFGFFQPVSLADPLTRILRRDEMVEVSTFNRHLAEFCEEKRGHILERNGQARAFRYRFRNPLMTPYVMLRGVADRLLDASDLASFIHSASKAADPA